MKAPRVATVTDCVNATVICMAAEESIKAGTIVIIG